VCGNKHESNGARHSLHVPMYLMYLSKYVECRVLPCGRPI